MADPRDLDPILHQPLRMRVMALVYRNRQAPFTRIRDDLAVTSGNLQSHGHRLAEAGYIVARKVLAPVFEVHWFITPQGQQAFEAYVRGLRALATELESQTATSPSDFQKEAMRKSAADDPDS